MDSNFQNELYLSEEQKHKRDLRIAGIGATIGSVVAGAVTIIGVGEIFKSKTPFELSKNVMGTIISGVITHSLMQRAETTNNEYNNF